MSPAPTLARKCTAGDLTASEGHTGKPLSNVQADFATQILLRNASRTTCRLNGWAGIALYGDSTIQSCTPGQQSPKCGKPLSTSEPRAITVTRVTLGTPPDVPLAPGASTSFTLLWNGSYGPSYCDRLWPTPYGGHIWVPGDSRPLTLVPFPNISPCDGMLQITAFGVVG
jgi:hypothetical protein